MTLNEEKILELIEKEDLFVQLFYPHRGSGHVEKHFYTKSGAEFSSHVASRMYNLEIINTGKKQDNSWNGGHYIMIKKC